MDESRRGATLALAYGGGPLLAALGSLVAAGLLVAMTLPRNPRPEPLN